MWTLQWNTTQHKTSDALAVGCWDGTLSIYDLAGKQVCLITTLRQFITHAVLLHKLLQWKSNLCEHWVVAKNWFSDFTSVDDLIRWGMTRSLDLIHVVSPTMMRCTFVWVDQIKRSALLLSFNSSQEPSSVHNSGYTSLSLNVEGRYQLHLSWFLTIRLLFCLFFSPP